MVRFNHYDSIYDATLYWINGVDADHAEKWAVRPTQPHFLPYHAVFLSFFGMVLIMSCHLTPFLYVILKNALMNIHQSQEEVAEIYGGTFFYRFRKIIAPLFASGYSMGALLIFVKQ